MGYWQSYREKAFFFILACPWIPTQFTETIFLHTCLKMTTVKIDLRCSTIYIKISKELSLSLFERFRQFSKNFRVSKDRKYSKTRGRSFECFQSFIFSKFTEDFRRFPRISIRWCFDYTSLPLAKFPTITLLYSGTPPSNYCRICNGFSAFSLVDVFFQAWDISIK